MNGRFACSGPTKRLTRGAPDDRYERIVTTLCEAFQTANGRRVSWRGTQVYSLLRFTVNDGDSIQVTRVSASPIRAQALKFAVDRGEIRANGVLVPAAAVWTHTAPKVATLKIVGKRARSLEVWNAWSVDGVDTSWIGNAAMMVESDGQVHTIRCSDGVGKVTFEDLAVRLEVTAA